MINALKLATLLLYIAGLLAAFTTLFGVTSPYIMWVALFIFAAHFVELAVAYKYLKRHPGGMAESVLLCILFGLLHWWPLKKSAQAR